MNMNKKDSIALIGFMATGKTTIGRLLAKALGEDYQFIETDKLIVNEVGKTIPQIFQEEGEIKFREYEIQISKKISHLHKIVVSCGGGIVLNRINIEYLKKNCYIVLLKANAEEIYKRIIKEGIEKRPKISADNPKEQIKNLLEQRENLYMNVAEIIINTTGKRKTEIITEILRKTYISNK